MEWQTDKRAGTLFGSAIIVALLLFDAGMVLYLRSRPIDGLTFVGGLLILLSLPAIGLVVYGLIGLLRSGYALDRNQLVIVWGPTRHIVPTRLIDHIVPGEDVAHPRRFRGGRWPGMWVGHGDVPEIGLTLFNVSAPIYRQLFVLTDMTAYAISPINREGFVEAFETRKAMGPTQDVRQTSLRPAFFDWEFWRDRRARGLLIGSAILCAGLFAYVCFKFPDLPRRIPLHFDAFGAPDRLGTPPEVFILPLIGLLTVLVNLAGGLWLYVRERTAAYVLWSGSILVQGFVWVAAVTLLV